MKKITFAVALALVLSYAAGAYAEYFTSHGKSDSVDISVTTSRNANYLDNDAWILAIKNADSPTGVETHSIDTSSVSMTAMGQREMVLGKVFLQVAVWDLYQVVVYSNQMDLDNDGVPNLPVSAGVWSGKTDTQKDDFVARHAGLQIQQPEFLDNEGFNSLLYGASLKVRSEGIHGTAAADGAIPYDFDNDGTNDMTTTLMTNQTIPDQLWNAKLYPNQVCFSPIPELASETIIGNDVMVVAGSTKGSPLTNDDGTPNWLEMIFGASEEGTGGDQTYSTKVYFDLRWN